MQDSSKRRARLILIVGILLAVLAGAGTFFYASNASSAQPVPVVETTPVLVAAREIPAKTTLTAADLKVVQYNVDSKPVSAYSKGEDAIGKVTIQAVAVGEPLLPTKFADPKNPVFVVIPQNFLDANGAIKADTPNFRAMSLTIPDPNAVGGILQPGDVVDIVFALKLDPTLYLQKPKPENGPDTSARIILERVNILARKEAVYTIRVDAVTAERLAYLQGQGGTLSMILRAPKDERASGATGTTFGDAQKAFGIKIPEKINP